MKFIFSLLPILLLFSGCSLANFSKYSQSIGRSTSSELNEKAKKRKSAAEFSLLKKGITKGAYEGKKQSIVGVMTMRSYDNKRGKWYYEIHDLNGNYALNFWDKKKIFYLRDKVLLNYAISSKITKVTSIKLLQREYYSSSIKRPKKHKRFSKNSIKERALY